MKSSSSVKLVLFILVSSKSVSGFTRCMPPTLRRISGLTHLRSSSKLSPRNVRHAVKEPDTSQLLEIDTSASQAATVTRVIMPALLGWVLGTVSFVPVSLLLREQLLDAGELQIFGNDSGQFIQDLQNFAGSLFAFLTGYTFYFIYGQGEALFFALYDEVTQAKSLLEQTTLVCQNRPYYRDVLLNIRAYVRDDLRNLSVSPSYVLSVKPESDPLENIMYLTSVGVPGPIYDTLRALRSARGERLASLQRKIPDIQMQLLYFLVSLNLIGFYILGAGTSSLFPESGLLTVQSVPVGFLTGGFTMTLLVIEELRQNMCQKDGAYNVDATISTMVRGLEEELEARLASAPEYPPRPRAQ